MAAMVITPDRACDGRHILWCHAQADRPSVAGSGQGPAAVRSSAARPNCTTPARCSRPGALKLEPPQNIAAMVADIRRWGEIGMIPALNARRTPQPHRRHRRRRRDDVQGTRRRRPRRRQRAAGHGRQGRRRGRAADPQPPLVPDRAVRRGRVGVRLILLNSEFSGPQIKEVSEREGAKLIIYDDEYTAAVGQAEPPLGKLRALATNPDKDEPSGSTDETLADLIARSSKSRRRRRPSTRRSSS